MLKAMPVVVLVVDMDPHMELLIMLDKRLHVVVPLVDVPFPEVVVQVDVAEATMRHI